MGAWILLGWANESTLLPTSRIHARTWASGIRSGRLDNPSVLAAQFLNASFPPFSDRPTDFGMALTPSHRTTREWPLLLLALALVCALCIPLWQWSAGKGDSGNDWSKWTPER